MNYLTNYYKNLCEELTQKANALHQYLREYEEIPPGCPDGNCEPIPVGDSDAILSRKEFQTQNPTNVGGPWIGPNNWQQIYNQWQQLGNGPIPPWFNPAYWAGPNWEQNTTAQQVWESFVNGFLLPSLRRAGGGGSAPQNPVNYQYMMDRWAHYSAISNNGTPVPFPVTDSTGRIWQARYAPQPGNIQVYQLNQLPGDAAIFGSGNMSPPGQGWGG